MFKEKACILFQGDSITDGGRGRSEDLNHVFGHSYPFLIASQIMAEYPEKDFKIFNRGMSANRIVDMYSRWEADALNLKPDVVSILIGINDIGFSFRDNTGIDANKFEKIYKIIIEETLTRNADTKLILCEPFVLPVGPVGEDWNEWNSKIELHREKLLSIVNCYNATFIQLQDVFTNACKLAPAEYWIWDGVHPTAAGHQLIAKQWIETVMG